MSQPFDDGFEFEEPAQQPQGDRYSAEDAQSKRLIIVPIEYVPTIRTQRGDEVDGIRVNVVDLDSQGGQAVYYGALWFGGRLISGFKQKIGKTLLGYITKEQTGGGFKAWVFHSMTQDEYTVNLAKTFIANHPDFLQTCQGDVQMAMSNPQQARAQQSQTAAAGYGAGPSPQGQQWSTPAQRPQGPPAPPMAPPPPPPAPPQGPTGPPPAPAVASGPPAAPAASTPPPPPGQMSVMERLRAQREGDEGSVQSGFESGPPPF